MTDIAAILDRERVCLDCQQPFTGLLSLCGDCANRRKETTPAYNPKLKQAERAKARAADWLTVCPPDYRETDWSSRGLSPQAVKLAAEWQSKPPAHSLALYGPTGLGKTRAAFAILARYHAAGRRVYAVHAGDAWDVGKRVQGLSSAARLQYSDDSRVADAAVECLKRCRMAFLLLLDDVGKERAGRDGQLSEAVGEAFFGLIEYRVSNQLPTIWTCNMGAAKLAERLGADRGLPLLRRLQEVSETPKL